MSILEESGIFWWHGEPIPAGQFAPETSIAGTLKVDDDGRARLDLHGFLPRVGSSPLAIFSGPSVIGNALLKKGIQGLLKISGKYVYLNSLHQDGGTFKSNGITHEAFVAYDCFVSDRSFSHEGTVNKISEIVVDLRGFEGWLRLSSIQYNSDENTTVASYSKPSNIEYDCGSGIIHFEYELEKPSTYRSNI